MMHALARFGVMTGVVMIASCAGGETEAPPPNEGPIPQRMIDEETLARLPEWGVDTLTTPLCVADGYGDCPLEAAWANGLGDGRVALWEPRRRVLVIGTDGTLTAVGDSASPLNIAAITANGRGFRAVVTDDAGWHLVDLDRAGKESRRQPLPAASPRNIIGFIGRVPIAQRLANMTDPMGGRLEVDRLEAPTDSTGTRLLEVQLPWLREANGLTVPAPLFATLPTYMVGEDGSVIWAEGQRFEVEARDRNGAPRWKLSGPAGPEITEEEYATRTNEAQEVYTATPLAPEDIERMRREAPTTHPAVTALVRTESGTLYVAGARPLSAASITWLRVSPEGEPIGRFVLDTSTRVLYARNDSLLVHRPTEGEPWEIRWIRLLPPE